MKRRTVLRRLGLGVVGGGSVGLAGCSESTTSDEQTPIETTTTSSATSKTRFLGLSNIESLEVVTWERLGSEGDEFRAAVEIENLGPIHTDLSKYTYDAELRDSEGNIVSTGEPRIESSGETVAGRSKERTETGTIELSQRLDRRPERFRDFGVQIRCRKPEAKGLYCWNPATDASSVAWSVARNDVEPVTIIDSTLVGRNDSQIVFTVTVQNDGSQTTDPFEFNYDITLLDENGEDVQKTTGQSWPAEDSEIDPGESAEMRFVQTVDGDPSVIDSYELQLTCGSFSDSPYCE